MNNAATASDDIHHLPQSQSQHTILHLFEHVKNDFDDESFQEDSPPGSQFPDWEQLKQDHPEKDDEFMLKENITNEEAPLHPLGTHLQSPILLEDDDDEDEFSSADQFIINLDVDALVEQRIRETSNDDSKTSPYSGNQETNSSAIAPSVATAATNDESKSDIHPYFTPGKFTTSPQKKNAKRSRVQPSSDLKDNTETTKKARRKKQTQNDGYQQTKLLLAFTTPSANASAPKSKIDMKRLWVGKSYQARSHPGLTGYIYTVSDLRQNGVKGLHAVCNLGACLPLSSTFLGEKEAKNLCASDECKRRVPESFTIQQVRCLRRNMFPEGNEIPVRLLNESTATTNHPRPFLVYDTGAQQTGDHTAKPMSDKYRVAYIHPSMLQPQLWKTTKTLNKPKPRVLDLCAGCGGMHLGLVEAGFDPVAYLVEHNDAAASTLERNFKAAHVYDECVRTFLDYSEQEQPGYPRMGDVDHLHGSFPCQGFSQANRNPTMSENDLANNELSYEFVRALRFFRPTTASFENVHGMLRQDRIHYLQHICAQLLEIGYHFRIFIIKASDFGDPQKRPRVILFTAPFDRYLPDEPVKDSSKLRSFHDCLDSLCDIEPSKGSGRVQLADRTIITQHSCQEDLELPAEFDPLSQCLDGFAVTVRRQRPIKHYVHRRLITIRERARLQSFPDWVRFSGSFSQRRDQIGNAVPVRLATALGESLMAAHFKVRIDNPLAKQAKMPAKVPAARTLKFTRTPSR